MRIINSPVYFQTPEDATIEARGCRGRSFSSPPTESRPGITRAALLVPWDEYVKILNAWQQSGNTRKSAWLASLRVRSSELLEGCNDPGEWEPDPPYLVDEAGCAKIAIFHLKQYCHAAPL